MADFLKNAFGLTLALPSPEIRPSPSDDRRTDRACTEASSLEAPRRRFSLRAPWSPVVDLRNFQPSSVRMFTGVRRPESSSPEAPASNLARRVYDHLLQNDLDTARVEVDLERRYHPENPRLEDVSRLLEGARQQAIGRAVVHLCNAAVLQEIQNLETDDRTRRAQSLRNQYGPVLQTFQEEVASGRIPVREAWNHLLSARPGIQEYLHQHELMPRIEALLRPETTTLQADETVLDVAYRARVRSESFAAARYLYASLNDSRHFGPHAREVLASLDGEERAHQMENSVVGILETVIPLAPVLADSNRTVLRNLSTIMGFRTAGLIAAEARNVAMPLVRGLVRSEGLRAAAGSLIGAGTNAAVLPLLNGGLDPIRRGTYAREFAHNFALQTFLGPLGSVFRNPIAGRLAAVGGMATFDALTDPTTRQISPWLLLANAAANDIQGRAGHFEGREELNPRTVDVRGAVNRGLDRMARAVLPLGGPLLSLAVGVPTGVPEATRIARRTPQRAADEPPPPPPPAPQASSFLAPFVSMEVETMRGPTDGTASPDHIPLHLQIRNHAEGRPRRGFGPDVRTLRIRVGNEDDRVRVLELARSRATDQGLVFEPMETVRTNQGVEPQFAVRNRDGRLLYIGRVAVGEVRSGRPPASQPLPAVAEPGQDWDTAALGGVTWRETSRSFPLENTIVDRLPNQEEHWGHAPADLRDIQNALRPVLPGGQWAHLERLFTSDSPEVREQVRDIRNEVARRIAESGGYQDLGQVSTVIKKVLASHGYDSNALLDAAGRLSFAQETGDARIFGEARNALVALNRLVAVRFLPDDVPVYRAVTRLALQSGSDGTLTMGSNADGKTYWHVGIPPQRGRTAYQQAGYVVVTQTVGELRRHGNFVYDSLAVSGNALELHHETLPNAHLGGWLRVPVRENR